MPEINGFDVLEWIRKRHQIDELPVILISALAEHRHVIQGLQAGANDYITKPVQMNIAQHRIETQLKIKRASDERHHLTQQLQKTNELQQRLMRIASHDLKNPLNTMLLSMKVLEQQYHDDTVLGIMQKQVDKMNHIVHEFLEMELMKENELQVNCEPVHYNQIVLRVLTEYEPAATTKGIKFQHTLNDDVIMADESRLEQVISNLVSNAIKYASPQTTVSLSSVHQDEQLRLTVQNLGNPIPAEEIDELFQPFSQVSTTPTAGEHSSGLGLWIVKQMIDAQNGAVGINTDFTEGAEFWISLPLYKEPLQPEVPVQPESESPPQPEA